MIILINVHLRHLCLIDFLTLSPSVCTSSESLHEIEELNRLPSYRSIASLIPAPLEFLPPTYDDSINGH